MPSSFSFVSYTGNGTTQTYNVPFQYISQAHVEVYLDGSLRTTGISWDSATTIRLNPAPNAGAIIRLSRNTPKTVALVDFQDAGILTESALDLNTRQGLLIVQEAFDEASNVITTAVAAAVAASQVAARSVPTVAPSDIGRLLVGRAADSFGWANNLTYNESTGVLTALGFSGPLTGNVAGNLTGNVTGNVTGNLTGNVTGNASGTSSNVTGIVALANGGTGATNQAAARTALGLGSAAQLAAGATGSNLVTAATQADARTALGLGSAALLGASTTGTALVTAADAAAGRTALAVEDRMILLDTRNITGGLSPNLDFQLPAGYSRYELAIIEIFGSAGGGDIYMDLSTNGGSSWINSAGSYLYSYTLPVSSSALGFGVLGSATQLQVWSSLGTSAGAAISGVVQIFSARESGAWTKILSNCLGDRAGIARGHQTFSGERLAAEDNNAFRIRTNVGNISRANVRLYGIK